MTSIAEFEITRSFKECHGRVTAVLYRQFRDLSQVEDALQETYLTALPHWQRYGPPKNPAGWIYTVAKRKIIDLLRKEQTRQKNLRALNASRDFSPVDSKETELSDINEDMIPDEQLSLIFMCCHPSLNQEAQVALTLRSVAGLTTSEIAHAFLVQKSAMAQRLVRAREKIKEAGIPFGIPGERQLPERLESVMRVIYLIFNEGYASYSGTDRIRLLLCTEAIYLARILVETMHRECDCLALLALLLLTDARAAARLDQNGGPLHLDEQDRSLWDQAKIREGLSLMSEIDQRKPRKISAYLLQAQIASLHAQARVAGETPWKQIALCYEMMYELEPGPVVRLNWALALFKQDGGSEGSRKALEILTEKEMQRDLHGYPWYHIACAEMRIAVEDLPGAVVSYEAAIACSENETDREYLRAKLREIGG